MKRGVVGLLVMLFVVSGVLVPYLHSQVKKEPNTGLDKFEGVIESIDMKASTFTAKQLGREGKWTVVFNDKTIYTFRNDASSLDEVKVGRRVIVLGTFEKGSNKMTATRVDIREATKPGMQVRQN